VSVYQCDLYLPLVHVPSSQGGNNSRRAIVDSRGDEGICNIRAVDSKIGSVSISTAGIHAHSNSLSVLRSGATVRFVGTMGETLRLANGHWESEFLNVVIRFPCFEALQASERRSGTAFHREKSGS
jgi:hypothetical protein